MRMRILGVRDLDFMAQDGNAVKGKQLFAAYRDDGVVGENIAKLFVRDGMELPPISPGMVVDISFTNRGKVESVKPAADSGNAGKQ